MADLASGCEGQEADGSPFLCLEEVKGEILEPSAWLHDLLLETARARGLAASQRGFADEWSVGSGEAWPPAQPSPTDSDVFFFLIRSVTGRNSSQYNLLCLTCDPEAEEAG